MPKYIKGYYEILSCPEGSVALEAAEKAARTCYKSENKITDGSAKKLVSTLLQSGHHAMLEFMPDITVKFVSNRGFTHEMVRHRHCSFAQESTRYVGYDKGKHGGEITITLLPDNIALNEDQAFALCEAHEQANEAYLQLKDLGIKNDVAREVLPIGLKAEIVVKANVREWRHIFGLRCSKKAHFRMRELMIPLLRDLNERIPIMFADLAEKYLDTDEDK